MIRESAEHGEQNICSGGVFASLLQLFNFNIFHDQSLLASQADQSQIWGSSLGISVATIATKCGSIFEEVDIINGLATQLYIASML